MAHLVGQLADDRPQCRIHGDQPWSSKVEGIPSATVQLSTSHAEPCTVQFG
jgi:hypothetical protein